MAATGKVIGTVTAVVGEVKATAADGTVRILQVGDQVYSDEVINTSALGSINVALESGKTLDCGANTDLALHESILGVATAASPATSAPGSDVAALQAAIAGGQDPSQVAPATAAGGAPAAGGVGGDGGSHEPVVLEQSNSATVVTSGFTTEGDTIGFPTPEFELLPIEEQPVVITVTLATSEINEDQESVTFVATLSQAGETDVTVHTDLGDILIPAGETTGALVVSGDLPDPDVYIDPDSITATVTGVEGGNFEAVDFSGASATANIVDTIDPVTVGITTSDVLENGASTFVVSVSQALDRDLTVQLSTGDSVVIEAGDLSANYVVAAQGDDVYVDPGSVTVSIAGASVANATFESLQISPASATSHITDTIDPTYVQIFGPATLIEGATGTYTVKLTNPPLTNVTVTLTYSGVAQNGSDFTAQTTVTFGVGETEKTFDLVTNENSDGQGVKSENFTITLSATGGTFESLQPDPTSGSITASITEVLPSTAFLLVNTSNTGGGGEAGNQVFTVSITNGDTTLAKTATLQDAEGQQSIALTFDQNVQFLSGQTYTVVVDHVSGSAHTNITNFFLTDQNGNQIVLNGKGGSNNTTLTGDETSSFDGVIYTVAVANNGNVSVSEPVGYDVNTSGNGDKTLLLNSALDSHTSFTLDFSDLPLTGANDIFGNVKILDIGGDGTFEDNTIKLNAQDVLDLGVSNTLFVKGEAQDAIQVTDAGGTWTQVGSVSDGGLTYVSYTATINSVLITLNIDQDLSKNLA